MEAAGYNRDDSYHGSDDKTYCDDDEEYKPLPWQPHCGVHWWRGSPLAIHPKEPIGPTDFWFKGRYSDVRRPYTTWWIHKLAQNFWTCLWIPRCPWRREGEIITIKLKNMHQFGGSGWKWSEPVRVNKKIRMWEKIVKELLFTLEKSQEIKQMNN
jgi:hypothetical protein